MVESKIAELAEACQGILRIHYGCDFHLYYDNVQDALANPSKYAVNHKRYVLVELSELLVLKSADEVLERMRSAGMLPIITHPERNGILQRHIDKLETWVADGCRLQVTAQSLSGGFGKGAKKFSSGAPEPRAGALHRQRRARHGSAGRRGWTKLTAGCSRNLAPPRPSGCLSRTPRRCWPASPCLPGRSNALRDRRANGGGPGGAPAVD